LLTADTLAGMEPDAQEIKERIDLVEYLSREGVRLKPVGGGGEYRGRCPFHTESKPSFQVNRHKGLWHCFGCGAGGDVISFVMKKENISFHDALMLLAGGGREESGDILDAAADYWHACLRGALSAQRYLESRGLFLEELIERYRVGFAPGRTKTRDRLLASGFSIEETKEAGLVNHRGLDALFGRVTFPLVERGKTVNIYGRSLSERFPHMYLPARRDVIFNIDHVEGDGVILTESVIDALSLIVLGFNNAVSCLSAQLTIRQVETLSVRFKRVDVMFDRDEAGDVGAKKAAELLAARGVIVRVTELPAGADVNSLLVEGIGRQDFDKYLNGGAL